MEWFKKNRKIKLGILIFILIFTICELQQRNKNESWQQNIRIQENNEFNDCIEKQSFEWCTSLKPHVWNDLD